MRDRRAQGRWPSKQPPSAMRCEGDPSVTSGLFRFISIQQYPGPPLTNPEYGHAAKIVMFKFRVQVPRKHAYSRPAEQAAATSSPKIGPQQVLTGGVLHDIKRRRTPRRECDGQTGEMSVFACLMHPGLPAWRFHAR
ncbi:hypothetical protein Landi51_07861 [Colletotrichum acutatum]